jgi:hypothetical protein
MANVLPFDHAESRRRRDHSERAKDGRKKLACWRRAVEEKIRCGALTDFDGRLADALMAYPSSVLSGYLWPSQETLASSLRKHTSTIGRGIARLKRAGLIDVQQCGNGRSARCSFCIDNQLLMQADARALGAHRRAPGAHGRAPLGSASAKMRGLAPAKLPELMGSASAEMRDESYKQTESYNGESSPPPPTTAGLVGGQRQPSTRASIQTLHNKIVHRLGNGDIALGWRLMMTIKPSELHHLVECERAGAGIDEEFLTKCRADAINRLERR